MTNLDGNIVDRRVLIDWDGDGFYNNGVAKSTPPNLFPTPLYPVQANLNGVDTAGLKTTPTDTSDPSPRGLVKRSIRMGDEAETIRFMLDDYQSYQPHDGDEANLVQPGSSFADFISWSQSGGKPTGATNSYSGVPAPVVNDNGRLGFNMLKLAYDPALGGVYASLGYKRDGVGGAYNYYSNAAFYSSFYSYIANTGESLAWSGMPVTAGSTYIFTAWIYLPAESTDLTFAGGSPTVYPTLYVNGGSPSTYPVYDRQYVQGSGGIGVTYNTWTKIEYGFTVPSGSASYLGLDIRLKNSVTGSAYIGGIMLQKDGVYPTRFWDSNIGFYDEQFSYVFPGDNQPYTVSFYTRSPNGITKLIPSLKVAVLGTNTITSTALSDVTLTTDWQRVEFTVPASTSRRGAWLVMDAEKSGVPVDSSHAGDVEFSGFQIIEGTTNYPFHAGVKYGYEDITSYALSVTTRSGKNDFNSALPEEGTADIVLSNDSKLFSPSNSASPLYGYLNANLKTKIQIKDNNTGEWVDMWSGWTYQYDVTPGRDTDRQATISCQQGLYRLSEGTLQSPTKLDTTADVLATSIISSSGFRAANDISPAPLGLVTQLGVNAYTDDLDLLYETLDAGVNRIEISNKDWTNETDPRKALDDTLSAENAQLFILRNGKLSLFNRDYWITDVPTDTFTLDTEVNQAEYVYGRDIVNGAEITIQENKERSGETVWTTKRPVVVNPNQKWVVSLTPQYTEGTSKSVIEYTSNDIVKTVYKRPILADGDTTNAAVETKQADLVTVELLGEAGAQPQVRVINSNPVPVWVHIEVKGTYLERGDGLVVRVEDETSVNTVKGKHIASYSSPILTDTRDAASWGEYRMLRQSEPRGEFTSFKIAVRNQADLDRVLALGVGKMVSLTEVQSAETGNLHAIIGEDFEFTNSRTLTATFHTARTLQEEFAKVDKALAGDENNNILRSMYAIQPTLDATVLRLPGSKYGVNVDVQRLNTGFYGKEFLLTPAPGQYRLFKSESLQYKMQRWPWTDSVGNAVTPLDGYLSPIKRLIGAPYYGNWVLPKNVEHVYWMTIGTTRQTTTAAAVAQLVYGMDRNKTTDDSVAPTTRWLPKIHVTPDASYELNSYGFLMSYLNLPGQAQETGQALYAVDGNGALLQDWFRTGTAVAGNYITPVTAYESMTRFFHRFVSATPGSEPLNTIGIKLYEKTSVFETEGISMLDLRRYDRNGFGENRIVTDPTEAYYYTVFFVLNYGSPLPSVVLSVKDENDNNSAIATDATYSATSYVPEVLKLQVSVPASAGAWDGIQAELRIDAGAYTITSITVLAHGLTRTDPATANELVQATVNDLVHT